MAPTYSNGQEMVSVFFAIKSRLEKSLGCTFNIQLKQEMGVFQASMLEAMKSLRDEMLSFKQEFRRIVLCHQLWLKTEAGEIQKDKNYAGHK